MSVISYQVPSEKVRQRSYTVQYHPLTRQFTCDCPDYVYRKGPNGQYCKHIKQVREQYGI